ncbi:MAG: hypothetical protein FJ304_07420 [Planctomycetes bacterium]|nr:hypothetical protein [Planctomycetota bacterium]
MFSAFLNPFTLIAGGLLVSTPIIIHLINRIRFRRVKWAAMEFLLKAQKRMRRRKILEQLILLLLRCLLVFLVGLLLARFVGCDPGGSGKETRPTTHVVVLDDTPSMADVFRREDGTKTDAYSEAKRLLYEKLMPATAEASTAQTMQVIRLSDLDLVFPKRTKTVDGKARDRTPEELREAGRVKTSTNVDLEEAIKPLPVGTVRKSLVDGLKRAKKLLDDAPPGDARVIHVLSDLRSADWAADGPAVSDLLREFKENNVTVHLIDVGSPVRKVDRKSPAFNDNVSIIEVKPRNRVVSLNQQTEIDVRVRNNGGTDLKDVGLSFYLNGQGNVITSAQIPTLPANQERIQTVTVTFTAEQDGTGLAALKRQLTEDRRAAGKPELTPDEEREHDRKWRALSRFRVVTASLSNEAAGLTVDNSRHAVVEIRDALKVLVVDGRTIENGVDLRRKPEGDSHFLRTLLETKDQGLGNIIVEDGDYNTLDKKDLRPYSVVYLMNVPGLSAAGVANLEKFVREGGGVGVFLGPNVKPDEYTAKFYRPTGKGGEGFFPVPLPSESTVATDLQKKLRLEVLAKRLVLREPTNRFHPALAGIYLDERKQPLKQDKVEPLFILPNIDARWSVSRRGSWREDARVRELYALQNETPIAEFEQRADDLVTEVRKKYNEPKFEKARRYAEDLLEKIRKAPKEATPLSVLARYLDQLLCDQINDGDESEPILREFWTAPELAEAKRTAMLLRDEAKFGDPLYVVKEFGFGRVAVMTTDAGGTYAGKKVWNDWPSLGGAAGWVVIVGEMQKYLTGGGDDANRTVGTAFTGEFDLGRYEPNFTAHLLTTSDPSKPTQDRKLTLVARDLDPEKGGKFVMAEQKPVEGAPADAAPRPYKLTFDGAKESGAYLLVLKRIKAAGPVPKGDGKEAAPDPFADLDIISVPFNVDALAEGDLRRANTDDLAQYTNKAPLHNTEDLSWIEDFKQKPSDLSSRRWIYLVILLLLIAEQAWAVRISYHTRPEDLEALAPSAAAAFAHHATLAPASAGEPAATETTG